MVKAPANQETLLRKHCFRNVSPFVRTGNICRGNIFLRSSNKKCFGTFLETFCCRSKCFRKNVFRVRGPQRRWTCNPAGGLEFTVLIRLVSV